MTLTASRPLTDEEIEVVLGWAAEASNQRNLSEKEMEVRRAVFVEHCQVMAAQFGRERALRKTASA